MSQLSRCRARGFAGPDPRHQSTAARATPHPSSSFELLLPRAMGAAAWLTQVDSPARAWVAEGACGGRDARGHLEGAYRGPDRPLANWVPWVFGRHTRAGLVAGWPARSLNHGKVRWRPEPRLRRLAAAIVSPGAADGPAGCGPQGPGGPCERDAHADHIGEWCHPGGTPNQPPCCSKRQTGHHGAQELSQDHLNLVWVATEPKLLPPHRMQSV